MYNNYFSLLIKIPLNNYLTFRIHLFSQIIFTNYLFLLIILFLISLIININFLGFKKIEYYAINCIINLLR